MTSLDHERCRELVLDGAEDDRLTRHLQQCAPCAALAERVGTVRRLAPSLGTGSPPPGLDDRIVAALRTSPRGRTVDLRRRALRGAARAAVGAAAAIALVVGLVGVPDRGGSAGEEEVANTLLAAAQETASLGTARLHIDGRADAGGGRVVAFGGTGELGEGRLHYRGTSRAERAPRGGDLTPFEVTVIGKDAWSRRADGTWVAVDRAEGPLAPLVLDAGSVLHLLRLPKERVEDLGQESVDGAATHRVRFHVTPTPGLDCRVDAWVGMRDGVLRQLVIQSARRSSGEDVGSWWSTTTVRLFGFGERVRIAPPAVDPADAAQAADARPEPAFLWSTVGR